MPQSKLRREALRVARPYLNATGLDQNWEVFAPEPRRESIALHALVDFTDGSRQTWRIPSSNPVTGSYWQYHWQKWQDWVLDEHLQRLWAPAAAVIAPDPDPPGAPPPRLTPVRPTA